MNRAKIFRLLSSRRFATPTTAVVFGFLLTAAAAKAGCGGPMGPTAFPLLNPQENASSNLSDDDPFQKPGSIVGLWHVIYTATYSTPGPLPVPIVPPGVFQLVQSYKTWHSDGTEMDNAFLPPVGGNVCFGVWKQLGNGSVKEHHIGLMFAPDGSLANVFTEDEIDRVSHDGKAYQGTFDQKLFDPTDVFGTGTPVQEIKGTTAATRITVD
ncbi:MAG TPA: hypothetical protein VF283_04405 [Bryobacteraceae bacterium]